MMKPVLFLTMVLAIWTGAASAFRCGSDLVQEGDRKIEVLEKCGRPDHIEVWKETRQKHIFRGGRPYPTLEHITVEEWTYNFGPTTYIRVYRFENGEVVDMERGDYGF